MKKIELFFEKEVSSNEIIALCPENHEEQMFLLALKRKVAEEIKSKLEEKINHFEFYFVS